MMSTVAVQSNHSQNNQSWNVKPAKPWQIRPRQLAENIGIVVLILVLTPFLLDRTPLNGKLGGAFIIFIYIFNDIKNSFKKNFSRARP